MAVRRLTFNSLFILEADLLSIIKKSSSKPHIHLLHDLLSIIDTQKRQTTVKRFGLLKILFTVVVEKIKMKKIKLRK